jgi:hypothetical protein
MEFRGNAKYAVSDVIGLAVNSALRNLSLEATAYLAGGLSSDNAILHLKSKAIIENTEQMLFELLDRGFLTTLRRMFSGFEQMIAIDFTPEPFYGDKTCPYVTGYEPKDGTYYCFKFLTVSLLLPKGKYLLFAYPAYRDTDRIWLLNRAFEFLARLGIKPKLCLMDREFYAVDVLALCREKATNYLIPAKHDSKFERTVKQAGKLPLIFIGYEITNEHNESEWTNLVVMESENTEKKEVFGFITNMHESVYRDDAYLLAEIYRKRWIIETAHRVHDEFRIRTCCKEGNVRYFFFVVAVLLYNLWIYINIFICTAIPQKLKGHVPVWEMKELVNEGFLEKRPQFPIGIAI